MASDCRRRHHARRDLRQSEHLALLRPRSAETQGQIGYVLSSAVLNSPGNKGACTIVTQTLVDKNDPAFSNPTKPVRANPHTTRARTHTHCCRSQIDPKQKD